ncbi:MAG TPA: M23 family metallopeptidase, partial [bacterium]|nr:M23 family metallopeptidase [bacterium]
MRLGHGLGFLALALATGLAAGQAQDNPLKVTEEKGPAGTEVWAENQDPSAARWMWMEIPAAQNVDVDTPLPNGFVLGPLERRRLFTVSHRDPRENSTWVWRMDGSGIGDPHRDPDPDAVYRLPWAHGEKHTVVQGYFGAVTHQGLYALDFDLAEGTPVLASRAGIVVEVKQDSNVGGPSPSFATDGNDVLVMHSDATWAVYEHLRYHGAAVQVGQRVSAGQLLGYSGHTGQASGPHLHLAVYKATFNGPVTIPTVFYTGRTRTASLVEGRTYYAWQAGLPPFVETLGQDLDEGQLRRITRSASGPVTVRQERIDQRTLVWADNGSAQAQWMGLGMDQASNVRCSVGLPWSVTVPAHTEAYCFYVDF